MTYFFTRFGDNILELLGLTGCLIFKLFSYELMFCQMS